MSVFDIAGLSGFCLYVGVYAGLQFGKIDGNSMSYTTINGIAAFLVLISLSQSFNLASALIQIMWISISAVGVLRSIVSRRSVNNNYFKLVPIRYEVRSKKRIRVKKRRRIHNNIA